VPRETIEQFVSGRLRDTELATFALSLFDGVIKHRDESDRRIAEAAENWRVSRMATVDRNVLRLGTYELFYNPETPARVAFDEAIDLARRYGSADSPSFVNGVLDRLYQNLATPA
jgi:N utilization substance protein B